MSSMRSTVSFSTGARAGTHRTWCVLALLLACALPAGAASPVSTPSTSPGKGPSWGAIASMDGSFGYSFNQPSRALAEIAARAQCDRAAGRAAACAVRAYFDRACGAYATGNYGEWATGLGPTAVAAGQEAAAQCDAHLPTQPCKVVFSVCSPR